MNAAASHTATHEDAMLMMQFLRWGSEMGLEDSLRAIFSEDFDPEADAMENPVVGRVLTFGEALATMVKHGLLDRALVVDLLWVEGIWSRVEPHALRVRERSGEPRLYENFEALVK
jgi:hypothetical protein